MLRIQLSCFLFYFFFSSSSDDIGATYFVENYDAVRSILLLLHSSLLVRSWWVGMRRFCVSNKPILPRMKICKQLAIGRFENTDLYKRKLNFKFSYFPASLDEKGKGKFLLGRSP
jgi:hypothetical protein